MSKRHRSHKYQVVRQSPHQVLKSEGVKNSIHQQVATPSATLVDVCILTAGRFDLLKMCVAHAIVSASKLPFKMFLLDNGSPVEERNKNNDIFDMVKGCGESIRLQQNVGFPKGANELMSRGKSPLIMLITDDVMVEEPAINALVRRMDDPTIGLCGMKLLFPLSSTDPTRPAGKVQHIGHGISIRAEVTHPLVGWSPENPKCNVSREVFSVTGAAFIVRRSLFKQVRGFNEAYGVGTYEDVELCLQIRQLGYKIFIDTNAVGYHHVGATSQMRKEGFPLLFNSMLFNSRWANNMAWTEWEMY